MPPPFPTFALTVRFLRKRSSRPPERQKPCARYDACATHTESTLQQQLNISVGNRKKEKMQKDRKKNGKGQDKDRSKISKKTGRSEGCMKKSHRKPHKKRVTKRRLIFGFLFEGAGNQAFRALEHTLTWKYARQLAASGHLALTQALWEKLCRTPGIGQLWWIEKPKAYKGRSNRFNCRIGLDCMMCTVGCSEHDPPMRLILAQLPHIMTVKGLLVKTKDFDFTASLNWTTPKM